MFGADSIGTGHKHMEIACTMCQIVTVLSCRQEDNLIFKEHGHMKNLIVSAAVICLAVSSTSFASDYINQEQRQAAFCGKTFDGKNEESGFGCVTGIVVLAASCCIVVVKMTIGDFCGLCHLQSQNLSVVDCNFCVNNCS